MKNKEEEELTTTSREGGRTLHPHWPVAQPLYCEDERKHITMQQQPLSLEEASLQGEYSTAVATKNFIPTTVWLLLSSYLYNA